MSGSGSNSGTTTNTNFECTNDHDYAIPIAALTVGNVLVPVPSGDTFTVTDTSVGITGGLTSIGTLSDGVTPAVLIASANQSPQPGIVITLKDSAGLAPAEITIDIVADEAPAALFLDTEMAQSTVVPSTVVPSTSNPA